MFVITRDMGNWTDLVAFTQDEECAKRAIEWLPGTDYEEVKALTGYFDCFQVSYKTGGPGLITEIKLLNNEETMLIDTPGVKAANVATRERAEELLKEWNHA